MSSSTAKQTSELCFIKPKYEVQEANEPYYLGPLDLPMLSLQYIQKGLLFTKPSHFDDDQIYSTHKLLESLKASLTLTLVHFYPLAGQLATRVDLAKHESLVYVDCNKGPGAQFIYATSDVSVSDILSPADVPQVVQSFFDLNRAANHDGHRTSLLSIKVTELLDGVFIGCSMNHALADGTSFWHFWNIWSEIHRAKHTDVVPVPRNVFHKRWFPDGYGPSIPLPFTRPDEFLSQYDAPMLRERIFHFSAESMARLKAKANAECSDENNKISSFQALSALCWRSIIRANRLPHDQVATCKLAINNRHRLNPPLPQEYFGNCISTTKTSIVVAELLEHSLGWAAALLHQSVVNHSHKTVHDSVIRWLKSPIVYQLDQVFDSNSVLMGSSPRFNMYGNEFGLGKAVAVRSGYANKSAGKVTSYEGFGGGGSVTLEICLTPCAMEALESDEEFMAAVSPPLNGYKS